MAEGLSIVIRCSGKKPLRLFPGQKLRVGRHASNEFVLNDGTVSRFHGAIVWDLDEDRPYVVDNESANGIEVDGGLIDERQHLTGGNSLQIGKFTLAIELRENETLDKVTEDFLVADDADEQVKLFSDKGGDMKGELTGRSAVQRLCLDLEEGKRTGTLKVTPKEEEIGEFQVVFSQGRVVTAEGEDMNGRQALRLLLGLTETSYVFSRAVTPSETEFLDLSVIEFLTRDLGIDTKKLRTL